MKGILKKVSITNYHGFKDKVTLDFSSTKDYEYNTHLIYDKIVKNALIYGKNGSGKSTLCKGLMDITLHLLDKQKDNSTLPHTYFYVGNDEKIATFEYVFQFGKDEVEYIYKKSSPMNMVYESLYVNGKVQVVHDFIDETNNFIKLEGASTLQTRGLQSSLSVIRYIYNNTIRQEDSIIEKIFNFVSGMLYFRSLQDANEYIGYKLGSERIEDAIIQSQKLGDFRIFLEEMGLVYDLHHARKVSGEQIIIAKFGKNAVDFQSIMSSGTKMLELFYYWSMDFDKLSFLVIDEFDAYYHHETAQAILNLIHKYGNMQSVISTHGITLMNNKITRPDCCYIINNNTEVKNLCNCTSKIIRQINNLEKMYREGDFTE